MALSVFCFYSSLLHCFINDLKLCNTWYAKSFQNLLFHAVSSSLWNTQSVYSPLPCSWWIWSWVPVIVHRSKESDSHWDDYWTINTARMSITENDRILFFLLFGSQYPAVGWQVCSLLMMAREGIYFRLYFLMLAFSKRWEWKSQQCSAHHSAVPAAGAHDNNSSATCLAVGFRTTASISTSTGNRRISPQFAIKPVHHCFLHAKPP